MKSKINVITKRIGKKAKESKAFTLAEALVTIIIMLLVSSVVAAGIPAAARAYNNVVIAANAETLLSTTIYSLRNELTFSKDISYSKADAADDNYTVITYFNESVGSLSSLSLDTDGNIMIRRNVADGIVLQSDDTDALGSAQRFVSEKESGEDLYVTYGSVAYDSSSRVVTFTDLVVKRTSDDSEITDTITCTIKVLVE